VTTNKVQEGSAVQIARRRRFRRCEYEWFFVGRFVERDVRITPQTKNAIMMAAKIQSSAIGAFRRPHV
jgi:hypothetical protein